MVRWGHFRCFRGICSTKNETSCFVRIATPGPTTPLLFSVFESWQHCYSFPYCDWVSCSTLCVLCSEWMGRVAATSYCDQSCVYRRLGNLCFSVPLWWRISVCFAWMCARECVCVCVCLFMTDCIRVASVQSEPGQNLLIQPPLGRKRGLRQVWTSPFFMCPMCPCNLMALSMCYLNSHLSKYITRK